MIIDRINDLLNGRDCTILFENEESVKSSITFRDRRTAIIQNGGDTHESEYTITIDGDLCKLRIKEGNTIMKGDYILQVILRREDGHEPPILLL